MDKPLSNLDALLKRQTRTELKRLHDSLVHTFVFVTHDQEEAITLGTEVHPELPHSSLHFFEIGDVGRRL